MSAELPQNCREHLRAGIKIGADANRARRGGVSCNPCPLAPSTPPIRRTTAMRCDEETRVAGTGRAGFFKGHQFHHQDSGERTRLTRLDSRLARVQDHQSEATDFDARSLHRALSKRNQCVRSGPRNSSCCFFYRGSNPTSFFDCLLQYCGKRLDHADVADLGQRRVGCVGRVSALQCCTRMRRLSVGRRPPESQAERSGRQLGTHSVLVRSRSLAWRTPLSTTQRSDANRTRTSTARLIFFGTFYVGQELCFLDPPCS